MTHAVHKYQTKMITEFNKENKHELTVYEWSTNLFAAINVGQSCGQTSYDALLSKIAPNVKLKLSKV